MTPQEKFIFNAGRREMSLEMQVDTAIKCIVGLGALLSELKQCKTDAERLDAHDEISKHLAIHHNRIVYIQNKTQEGSDA